MGLFTKKDKKPYSLQEAMRRLETPKYKGYTTIPNQDGNGFYLVKLETASKEVEKIKRDLNLKPKNQIIGAGIDVQNQIPNSNNDYATKGTQTQREKFLRTYGGYETTVPRNHNNYNKNNYTPQRYGDYYTNRQDAER